MQYFRIEKGTTSKILLIDIYDSSSTVGGRLAGLVYNSAGLTAYYNREGAAGAATAITLATATKGTWATGGLIAIDATNMPGHYELHIPNAALATGANACMIELKGASNMVAKTIMIELTEAVALEASLTAMKGATFSGSTDSLEAIRDRGDAAWITATGFATPTNITAGVITTVTNLTNLPAAAALEATLTAMKGATFDTATDSLEALRNRGDAAWITATGFSTHTAADIWAVATRVLTAGTNIALAKGTGVTGFNDLDAAGVAAATWNAATVTYGTAGSYGLLIETNLDAPVSGATAPTAAVVADAVWDEAIAGHLGAGSTGLALNSASSAGDPWSTALPGAYGAGTAGKIVGDNVNATISSRLATAGYTAPDNTSIAAILVDTAEIGVAGAGLTNIDLPNQTMDIIGTITNVSQIAAVAVVADAVTRLNKSYVSVVTGIVGAASTTTSIVTSSLDPAASVTDQFKGKIVTFAAATTTAALRGQSTDITASTSAGVLTVTALTTAPVSGDIFVIT